MVALILGIIVFSYIIVLIFTHDYKRKNEILPILCVLVFILISKLMRVAFDASFIETILISLICIFLLALGTRFLLRSK